MVGQGVTSLVGKHMTKLTVKYCSPGELLILKGYSLHRKGYSLGIGYYWNNSCFSPLPTALRQGIRPRAAIFGTLGQTSLEVTREFLLSLTPNFKTSGFAAGVQLLSAFVGHSWWQEFRGVMLGCGSTGWMDVPKPPVIGFGENQHSPESATDLS